MIDWKPIADMPDAWCDGRSLLLWDEGEEGGDPVVGKVEGGCFTIYESYTFEPTHVAEITGP